SVSRPERADHRPPVQGPDPGARWRHHRDRRHLPAQRSGSEQHDPGPVEDPDLRKSLPQQDADREARRVAHLHHAQDPALVRRNSMKRRIVLLPAAMLLGGLLTACTNKAGESEAPVTVTVDMHQQPGFISVSANAPVQLQEIALASHFKNVHASDPQGFATIQLNEYIVQYSRRD